jgi:hypothetical protein
MIALKADFIIFVKDQISGTHSTLGSIRYLLLLDLKTS